MSQAHAHEVDHHVKTYIKVFVALLVLTVITVAVSYLHIPWVGLAIFIGLSIATVKASLVALYFMHLSAERRIIYVTLIVMILCVIGLFVLPVGMQNDPINGATEPPLNAGLVPGAAKPAHGDAHAATAQPTDTAAPAHTPAVTDTTVKHDTAATAAHEKEAH